MQTKTREWNMDYLRILACFMVILLHTASARWSGKNVYDSEWKFLHYYDVMARSCVALFFMLSGKLFLGREKMIPISKLLKRNIVKLFVCYFAWALFYAVDTVGFAKISSGNGFELIWENVLHAKYHLWYLPTIIGIYLIMPLLWCIAKFQEGKYLKYACAIFFVFEIMKNTIFGYEGLEESNLFIYHIADGIVQYSGYFLLGYALDRKKEQVSKVPRWLLGICLLGVLVGVAIIGQWHAYVTGKPDNFLYEYLVFPTYLEAVLIFLLFLRIPERTPGNRLQLVIAKISKYTLFVYLSHVFVLQHLRINFEISTLSFHALLSAPVLAIGIFVVCLGLAAIADHIPIVRKWLM